MQQSSYIDIIKFCKGGIWGDEAPILYNYTGVNSGLALGYRHWNLIDKYNENIGLSLVVGINYKDYTVIVVLINSR